MTGTLDSTRFPHAGSIFAAAMLLVLAFLAAGAGSAQAASDSFAGASSIGGKVLLEPRNAGNTGATHESGEPEHAGSPGTGSVWATWLTGSSPAPRTYEVWLCGSSTVDPLLAVYTGSAVNALTEVASNDDGGPPVCGAEGSVLRFTTAPSTTYRIAMDSKGAQGQMWLYFREVAPNDDFEDAAEVPAELPHSTSVDNRIATKEAGEPDPGGYGGGRTVWYGWTAPKDGLVSIDNCTGEGSSSGIAVYTGTAVNKLTEVASNSGAGGLCHSESEVRFQAVEGTEYVIQVDGNPDNTQLYLYFRWVPTWPVTVTRSGSGEGTVTSEPAGIECGLVCEAGFYRGPASDLWRTRVDLTATPAPGSVFVGWSGEGCSGSEEVCELVTESTGATVDAEFEALSPLSSLQLPGSGSEPPVAVARTPLALPARPSSKPKRPKGKCAKGARMGKVKKSKERKKRAKASKRSRRACKR